MFLRRASTVVSGNNMLMAAWFLRLEHKRRRNLCLNNNNLNMLNNLLFLMLSLHTYCHRWWLIYLQQWRRRVDRQRKVKNLTK
jgi:hypothetical protein